MLKEELPVSILNIFTFSMVLRLILLHLMEIFPQAQNFWIKTTVKHRLFVVK